MKEEREKKEKIKWKRETGRDRERLEIRKKERQKERKKERKKERYDSISSNGQAHHLSLFPIEKVQIAWTILRNLQKNFKTFF